MKKRTGDGYHIPLSPPKRSKELTERPVQGALYIGRSKLSESEFSEIASKTVRAFWTDLDPKR